MNIQNYDIMKYLVENKFVNQRILAEELGYSLGSVNQVLKFL